MSSREQILKDLALYATGLGLITAALAGGVLWLGGAFSFAWLARTILAIAVVFALLELVVLVRTISAGHIHTPHTSWRRVDKLPGYSMALLLGLLIVELLFCGVLFGWVASLY